MAAGAETTGCGGRCAPAAVRTRGPRGNHEERQSSPARPASNTSGYCLPSALTCSDSLAAPHHPSAVATGRASPKASDAASPRGSVSTAGSSAEPQAFSITAAHNSRWCLHPPSGAIASSPSSPTAWGRDDGVVGVSGRSASGIPTTGIRGGGPGKRRLNLCEQDEGVNQGMRRPSDLAPAGWSMIFESLMPSSGRKARIDHGWTSSPHPGADRAQAA